MKRTNCVYYLLVCMLLCFTACEKDNSSIEDEIPVAIKSDFSKRSPSAEITTFNNYSNNICLIDFIDQEQNKASAWYDNEDWKMTYTQINDIQRLPFEVLNAFMGTPYCDAKEIKIAKTERAGIEKGLYMIHFQYRWKDVENVEHYVFISEDGLLLSTFTWKPNDTRWFVKLPQDHFDFITKKYNGAEIKGYVNNAGEHEYFILHNDTIKYVTFRGNVSTDWRFWKETRYELNKDTKIPDNVATALTHIDPDFTYTNLYYIESNDGNWYFFQDKNKDNELGYTIREDTTE